MELNDVWDALSTDKDVKEFNGKKILLQGDVNRFTRHGLTKFRLILLENSLLTGKYSNDKVELRRSTDLSNFVYKNRIYNYL